MSFWQELKQRKVIRVGVTYIIVAWLLVQVADTFFPALNLPDWTITLVAGLVILGFPIALLLAWAYDLTPHGTKADKLRLESTAQLASGNKLNYAILGLLVLLVLLVVVDRFLITSDSGRQVTERSVGAGQGLVMAGVIPLPDSAPLASGIAAIGFDGPLVTLSPDGQWLVYVGRFEGGSRLYLHNVATFDPPVSLPGTEGAIQAFFSPDGQSIGFLTDDKLKRVSLDGQELQTIASVNTPVRGKWFEGDIVYLVAEQGNAINRIDLNEGTNERLLYSWSHRFSEVLEGGRYALGVRLPFSINGDQGDIDLVDLEDETGRLLGVNGYDPRVLSSGHLVFSRHGNLQIVGFDVEKLEITGKPRVVQGGIALDSIFYQSQYSLSESGNLAYVPGADRGVGRIVSQERQGAPVIVTPEARIYGVFDLSHDERTLVIHIGDVPDYVTVFDLQNQRGRKLPGSQQFGWPVLSEGNDVALSSLDQTSSTIIRLGHLDRSADEQEIELTGLRGYPMDWSIDAGTLVLSEWKDGGRIARLKVAEKSSIEWFDTEPGDWAPVYSTDDKWLAYASNRTGRYEIWIRPADGSGQPRQLSANGGIEPVWCDCGEVYFRRGDEIWSISVGTGEQAEIGIETLAFTMTDFLDTPGRSFDVSSDGSTVYYVQLAEPAIDDRIHVISNFISLVNLNNNSQ